MGCFKNILIFVKYVTVILTRYCERFIDNYVSVYNIYELIRIIQVDLLRFS